jgi:pyrimidine operon attenuation protein/uracil phosphoribosyltransferase
VRHPLIPKTTILEPGEIRRVLRRMAVEVVEKCGDLEKLMLVGIRTRGVPLAHRLAEEIRETEGIEVPLGILDITLYRDDLSAIGPQAVVQQTHLNEPIDGRVVVLCDDVLYTGRTVRAALDALLDYGRPKAVRLAVLIDRGHRELPVQADIVGKGVPTAASEVIEVLFQETDDEELVRILGPAPASPDGPHGEGGSED